MPDAYDYVVVGAGSAGCVIASRLSEDASRSVLLLEAGPKDRNPLIRFPLGEAFTVGGSIDWKLETVAEPGLGGRKMAQPRGRVLGGSSSINGQMYVRGHASDYDDWDANGCTGWSYGGVLPYFRRSENWKSSEDQFRGADGPLSVAPGRYRSPTCRRFLEAASEAGYPLNDDYNGSQQDGFGWLQYTHTHAFPFRCSTAHAYLKPARARPNLTVRTGAQATALTFDGRRCMGVTYSQNGRSVTVRAGREVILSAGAYHTPHLLLLSGVGPADDLVAQGISVVADMPGVGKNLQDHAGAFIQHKADVSDSYHKLLGPIGGVSACARLFLQRTGPLTVFPLNVTGFVRSDASL
ncbi:MAG: GMC family oxidoreductase N-terminal domain-containing protein, partial [Pseudomonadota bacterium]